MRLNSFTTFYKKKRLALVHVAAWTLFIAYEQFAIFLSQGKLGGAGLNVFYYCCNLALFYLHRFFLNRYLRKSRPRYVLVVVLTLVELIIFLAIKFAADYLLIHGFKTRSTDWPLVMVWDLYRSLFFIGLATLIWTAVHIEFFREDAVNAGRSQLLAERDKAVLEVQLAQARNAYYQHQLNPHLLFNTLNFIYNNAYEKAPEASRGILLLSEILRFSLDEGDEQGLVPLQQELVQLRNLIEINQLRFGGRLALQFDCEEPSAGIRIIPLILLTLTENIFKHGLVNDPFRAAELSITIDKDHNLSYFCRNYKLRETTMTGKSRLGIRNVRLRLDQAYAGHYHLDIQESESIFQLKLNISL